MKLRNILQQLPQETLEALARKRLSQVTDIRLPPIVLVDELSEALSSFAYITMHVTLRPPPNFAIIHLLINAEDFSLPAENFRLRVQEETDRMVALASRRPIFPKPKEYDFYLRMLAAAWEYEEDINPSEANLLRVLREELGITLMEHFVMEHHPDLHRYWRSESAYEVERDNLLSTGILFTYEDQYMLPEELVTLIRRVWGIELSILQFQRLLDAFTNEDLKRILEQEGLTVSGTAQEKKIRIIENYVLPRAALEAVSIENLRSAARSLFCRPAGNKEEVIDNILDWLDSDEDLKAQAARESGKEEDAAIIPEKRGLSNEAIHDLMRRLTNESLYDILARLPRQRKSGNKEQRVKRLLDSSFSEHTLLMKLTNEVLQELCRQIGINPYGAKEEKVMRVIDAYRNFTPPSTGLGFIPPPGKTTFVDSEVPMVPAAQLEGQLPLLPSVRTEFPFLNEPEQIVLSYLQQFKSLSDPELDKLVQRFAMPWVLPKAQMAELIDKLRTSGHDIIKIRALGDNNIYQLSS